MIWSGISLHAWIILLSIPESEVNAPVEIKCSTRWLDEDGLHARDAEVRVIV